MKLIIHELEASGHTQRLTATRNQFLVAVRPHIYRHNWPTGTLKMQVLSDADALLAESDSVDIADIGTLDFFHGYVRFYVNVGLVKDTVYKFKLIGAGGYTFDEAAYVGWCNGYDLLKYDADYTPTNNFHQPLDMENWERKPR